MVMSETMRGAEENATSGSASGSARAITVPPTTKEEDVGGASKRLVAVASAEMMDSESPKKMQRRDVKQEEDRGDAREGTYRHSNISPFGNMNADADSRDVLSRHGGLDSIVGSVTISDIPMQNVRWSFAPNTSDEPKAVETTVDGPNRSLSMSISGLKLPLDVIFSSLRKEIDTAIQDEVSMRDERESLLLRVDSIMSSNLLREDSFREAIHNVEVEDSNRYLEICHSLVPEFVQQLYNEHRLSLQPQDESAGGNRFNKYMPEEFFERHENALITDFYDKPLRVRVYDKTEEGAVRFHPPSGSSVHVYIIPHEKNTAKSPSRMNSKDRLGSFASSSSSPGSDIFMSKVRSNAIADALPNMKFVFEKDGEAVLSKLLVNTKSVTESNRLRLVLVPQGFKGTPAVSESFYIKCTRSRQNRKKDFPLKTDSIKVVRKIGNAASVYLRDNENITTVGDFLKAIELSPAAEDDLKNRMIRALAGFSNDTWNDVVAICKRAMDFDMRMWRSSYYGTAVVFTTINLPVLFYTQGSWKIVPNAKATEEEREEFFTSLRQAYQDWTIRLTQQSSDQIWLGLSFEQYTHFRKAALEESLIHNRT